MVVKYTRWSPDTCSCVIITEADVDLPIGQVVSRLTAFEVVGAEHVTVLTDQERWNVVWQEVLLKGQVWEVIKQILTWTDENYQNWTFLFDLGRTVLRVGFNIAVTAQRKEQIQAACDAAFGVGKVIIE